MKVETFDDVIECIDFPDFESILEEFLEKMPRSRESVDELLDAIYGWDLWPIYNMLLTEYEALLTPAEIAKLKADYKELFSIPHSGEVV